MRVMLVCLAGLLIAPIAYSGDSAVGQSIEEVKARHTDRLMALPGVVSVGIGRDRDNQPAIVVGVNEQSPAESGVIPDELEGYRVITRATGPVRAQ